MSLRILIIVFIVIVIPGCSDTHTSQKEVESSKLPVSSNENESWKLLTGKWYGSQPTKDGGTKKFIAQRFSNGEYRIDFRITDKHGESDDSSEVGYWGISGNLYFTIFIGWVEDNKITRTKTRSSLNSDAYEILELNDKVFKYRHHSSGDVFTIRRVSSDFKFPE